MITTFHVVLGLWIFAVGTVVGSFLNVCIYRLAWQQSVIWPASHCPACLRPIAAWDNVPVLSWLALRGECRRCGARIAARYALVEALVGMLFAALFVTDVVHAPFGVLAVDSLLRMGYHQVLVAALVVATFIDYDFQEIPDSVTYPGMLLGLLLGGIVPGIRPDPGTAQTLWGGLWIGVLGWLVGGLLTAGFRLVFTFVFRREAMGAGDVTLMMMIGAFLGWQAAVLTFFLAPFFGIAHATWKLVRLVAKWLRGGKLTTKDRELAFGPYLSMAAVALVLSWPWLWPAWGRSFFQTLLAVGRFILGYGI
jgi:leader peptidase (prepilin peptidase)/N-methyltransferase